VNFCTASHRIGLDWMWVSEFVDWVRFDLEPMSNCGV